MFKILLPTDFSDNSWSAIVYALKMFEEESCMFFLLNSSLMRFSTMSNLSNSLMLTIQKSTRRELNDLKEQILACNYNKLHSVEILQSSEDLNLAIEWAVITYGIDIIVMGTKGATGAKEFFLGSNTNKVISKLHHCPILVIPDEYNFTQPKEIAFPTDFNRPFRVEEIEHLVGVVKLFNSTIRVVHINVEDRLNENQEYNMKCLDDLLNKVEHSFHWMPKYTKKVEEIKDFIEELDINLLAMVKYEHSLIKRITKEPVIKKIGLSPIIPFMVIPEKAI